MPREKRSGLGEDIHQDHHQGYDQDRAETEHYPLAARRLPHFPAFELRRRKGILSKSRCSCGYGCHHALFAFFTPLIIRSAATLIAHVVTNSTIPRMKRVR